VIVTVKRTFSAFCPMNRYPEHNWHGKTEHDTREEAICEFMEHLKTAHAGDFGFIQVKQVDV